MNPLDFPLLLDENLPATIAARLRDAGRDAVAWTEVGAPGTPDREVLALAVQQGRVVVTQDRDFGTLAIHAGAGFIGIVFLRPGHFRAAHVIEALDVLGDAPVDTRPPFVAVVDRRPTAIRVRVRSVRPPDPAPD